jgi:hypothetical protein
MNTGGCVFYILLFFFIQKVVVIVTLVIHIPALGLVLKY